jgi:5-methyltetrahydropteroyltriglutamate--homocysteine methyltransferase
LGYHRYHQSELARLAGEGVSYIQIDAPSYGYYIDPKWREWIRTEMRVEPEAALDEAIEADNMCLRAGINNVTLAIHLCRGNNRSHWYAEGGYDAIAERLFSTMDVERFLLKYDDERSETFEPLRFIPHGKTVVLGLVSSKLLNWKMQTTWRARSMQLRPYVPLENLALSPLCGFASTMEGNLLTKEQQWEKLRLVADTAKMVWK